MPRFLTADEEKELVLRGQAGDVEARNKAVCGITRFVWKMALKIAKDHPPADAADIAQQGILHVLVKFPLFDPHKGLRLSTYFGRAAFNVMLAAARSNGIASGRISPKTKTPMSAKCRAKLERLSAPLQSITPAQLLIEDDCDPAAHAELDELCAAVQACLAEMPVRATASAKKKFRKLLSAQPVIAEWLARKKVRKSRRVKAKLA